LSLALEDAGEKVDSILGKVAPIEYVETLVANYLEKIALQIDQKNKQPHYLSV